VKNSFLKPRLDGMVDERGRQILGRVYGRIMRITDVVLAVVAIIFYVLSFYKNINVSAKEVSILLVIIAFINRLIFKLSIRSENIIEK